MQDAFGELGWTGCLQNPKGSSFTMRLVPKKKNPTKCKNLDFAHFWQYLFEINEGIFEKKVFLQNLSLKDEQKPRFLFGLLKDTVFGIPRFVRLGSNLGFTVHTVQCLQQTHIFM